MAQKQKDLEMIGIYVVLGLIAFGFVAMLVALARSPRMVKSETTESVEAPVPRSRESVRTYNKPLSIHALGIAEDPMETPESSDPHAHLIPDAPTDDHAASPVSGPFPAPPAQPMRTSTADKDFLADDGEDSTKTGWGWLADDIESKRRPAGDLAGAKNLDQENQPRTDEADSGEQNNPAYSGIQTLEPSLFGVHSSAIGPADRDPLSKPLRELETSARPETSGLVEGPRSPEAKTSEGDERNEQRVEDRSAGLVMRDPFARDESSDRPAFGASGWTFGGDEESAMRSRSGREEEDPREVARERAGTIGSITPQFDDQSGRLVGDAVSDASRLSSGWSGYASDSVFSGGGGYTPRGVGAVGSDSLFSGSGAFGGSAAFSGIGSVNSSAGGISPIGGSSIGSLPTSGDSSLNNSGLGGDRSNPSALPW